MEFSSFDEMESAQNFDWLRGKPPHHEIKFQSHWQSMGVPSVFDDEAGLISANELDRCYFENNSDVQDSANDESAYCSEQQKFSRKRDQKHIVKETDQQDTSTLSSINNKLEKRKLQNKLAAQK